MYFGTPLSSAPEDLGLQGEYPPYPELLDWLAAEFIESGWNIKQVIREIVLSQTYRQSSTGSIKLFEIDPYNRLLARQSAVRLPAEMIRDNALSISGLLNSKNRRTQRSSLSAKRALPESQFPKARLPTRYRRKSVSTWRIHALATHIPASDADHVRCRRPGRVHHQRELSNSPLQALTLLNDPTQVEAARALAEILMAEKNDNARIEIAYQRALARKPNRQGTTNIESFPSA